ncbi:MAG: DoxX family protein [Nocardioides sp.]
MSSWIGLAARLITGGIWIVAGAIKLGDPAGSVRAVRAYQLLPESLVPLIGYLLPALEVGVGIALILGLLTRWFALLSALLFLAFIIGISSAWARGLRNRLWLLRWRRLRRRCHLEVPLGDRARRCASRLVSVPGGPAADRPRPRLLREPEALKGPSPWPIRSHPSPSARRRCWPNSSAVSDAASTSSSPASLPCWR